MDELQALWLGLVQGLTEYLPVSSSGHLAIASDLFDVDPESNLMFTVLVHVATVLATLVILWKEIVWLVKGCLNFKAPLWNDERKYAMAIVLSMIPVGIVGVFFKDQVEEFFAGPKLLLYVGIFLLCTAALLSFSFYAKPRQKEQIGYVDAFVIGLAQAVAVLPGVSRSGSTIATGLLLGCNKEKLAKFSFLMVSPPSLGEALLDVKDMIHPEEGVETTLAVGPMIVGFLAAFVSGCVACKWMINLVKKSKLIYFGIYCAIVGAVLIATHL